MNSTKQKLFPGLIFILINLLLLPPLFSLADGPSTKAEGPIPFISEVAPAAKPGQPAWLEIGLKESQTYTVYLPLILRGNTGGGKTTIASALNPSTLNLAGWVISDEDGNTYALPPALPPVPDDGLIVIMLDTGTDDLDFSDGVATLYASGMATDTFEAEGDQLALYSSNVFTPGSLVDFIAWGADPAEDDDIAVMAEKWNEGAYYLFDQGFGVGVTNSPNKPSASIGLWNGGLSSYRPANSSPGLPNPPPTPLNSTISSGAILSAETFGVAWSGVKDASYEFELATTSGFTNVLVSLSTPHPGWESDSPMPAGDYFWRVRTVDRNGIKSAYLGPYKITSDASSLNKMAMLVEKTLLADDQYKIQHKDSTMLDIGGGPGNSNFDNNGSPRSGSRDSWDGPHIFGNGNPSFKWNGYDNFYCVRASVTMINDYYGGNLSQDRLSYYIFEEWENNPAGNLVTFKRGEPENDMGYSWGIGWLSGQKEALRWALNAYPFEIIRNEYCPQPDPDLVEGVEDYECPYPDEDPMTWTAITGLIDAYKPFMSINRNNAHARVVDGYRITITGTKQVHILDPVPRVCNNSSDPCDGRRWENFETFRHDNELSYIYAHNLLLGPTQARNNEAALSKDSDNDGINDFDEIYRFHTNPNKKDTDQDWVNDKEDIAHYVFNSSGNYYKRVADITSQVDPDSLRKELDWDNDDDGSPDGCEDANGDGISSGSETSPFYFFESQPCLPQFTMIAPLKSQPKHVGPRNQPKNFWNVAALSFPKSLPKQDIPLYQTDDFHGEVITIDDGVWYQDYTILSLAQVKGEKVGLRITPPTVSKAGKHDLITYLEPDDAPPRVGEAYKSLIYGPRQLHATNILIDNSVGGSNPNKFQAIKAANQLFISQWMPGDQLGLITLGGRADMPFTPTIVLTDGRDLLPLRTYIDSLAPASGGNDLIGGLNLANSPPFSTAAVFLQIETIPGEVHSGLNAVAGDYNLDGSVDPVDYISSPFSNSIIYSAILPDSDSFPWAASLDDTAAIAIPAFMRFNRAVPGNPQTEINQIAAAFKASAEAMLDEERLLTTVGIIAREDRFTYTVQLDEASTLAFSANFSDTGWGGLDVFRPDGQRLSSADTDVQHTQYGYHEHFRVMNPASGLWTLVVKSVDANNPGVEYIAFVSADSASSFNFVPGFKGKDWFAGIAPTRYMAFDWGTTAGSAQPAKASSGTGELLKDFSGWTSVALEGMTNTSNLSVSAVMYTPTAQTSLPLPLFDDGLHQDGSANDGLYSSLPYTLTASGPYVIQAVASGIDVSGHPFTRTIQDHFYIQKPLAYVHSASSNPETAYNFQALLAEVGIPLVGVTQNNITSTNWNQFEAIIIAPDSAPFNSNWGTLGLGLADIIESANLPLIGLGEGGYALFADLGLDIGSNGITATSGLTQTEATVPTLPIWHNPYALTDGSPYRVYTNTTGLTLNVPVATPPPGVTIVATDVISGHALIATEDDQFIFWGFQAGAEQMTDNGERLFLNLIIAMLE